MSEHMVNVWVCIHAHVCVEARGQSQVSFLSPPHPPPLKQNFSLGCIFQWAAQWELLTSWRAVIALNLWTISLAIKKMNFIDAFSRLNEKAYLSLINVMYNKRQIQCWGDSSVLTTKTNNLRTHMAEENCPLLVSSDLQTHIMACNLYPTHTPITTHICYRYNPRKPNSNISTP